MFIGSFYRPTDSNPDPLKALDKSLRSLASNGALPNVILSGDMNLPSIDWDNLTVKSNPQYGYMVNRLFLDIVEEHALHQNVHEPTRLDNILDLVLTTYPDTVSNVQVSPGMSDHSVVTAEISLNLRRRKMIPRKVFLFKKMDITNLKTEARAFKDKFIAGEGGLGSKTTNENWVDFKTNVNSMLEKNVPQREIKDRWDVHWMGICHFG